MISKDKTYKTRDGREVRIYATDGYGESQIHGAVKEDHRWCIYAWYQDGRYALSDYKCRHDLIEVKPRILRTVWLHIFNDSTVLANEPAYYDITNRLACVKVEIDCEEGEGL